LCLSSSSSFLTSSSSHLTSSSSSRLSSSSLLLVTSPHLLLFISSHLFVEFFTVLHVFLLESSRIRSIPGIPQNGILAIVPAKIVISVPWNSGRFQNGHRNHGMESHPESTGMESTKIFLTVIVIFKSNSNYFNTINNKCLRVAKSSNCSWNITDITCCDIPIFPLTMCVATTAVRHPGHCPYLGQAAGQLINPMVPQ